MSDTEIVQEFLVESYENLDRLDRELVSLEKKPDDVETLASIFRTIHTIKGTCGFLGFSKLEAVAHVGENLLSKLRERLMKLTPQVATGLLAMVDAVRQMLASIEATGQEGERNDAELIGRLTVLLTGQATTFIETETAKPNALRESAADVSVARDSAANSDADSHDASAALLDAHLVNEDKPEPAGKSESTDTAPTQSPRAQPVGASESTIRVDVGLLDKLMNLVGELVLARNQILQFTHTTQDAKLQATSQRLNLLTTEIQSAVMKTRMQPIGNIWSKFPRTVRDLALACGKEVIIEMEGKETELDKTIIESVKDPLTQVMQHLDDINEVGKGIAVAFVATFMELGWPICC